MSKPDKQKTVQVTSLKTLGNKDPEFHLPVVIKKLGGEEVTIGFTAKALRKTEWAALRDKSFEEIPAQEGDATPKQESDTDEAKPVTKFSFVDFVHGDMGKFADLVMKFATGWDLSDPFTHQSLIEMEDQVGGSLTSTLQAYDAAIFQGRLGN